MPIAAVDGGGLATPDKGALSVMVARNFAKLMAYKDEYEFGRLHADSALKQ